MSAVSKLNTVCEKHGVLREAREVNSKRDGLRVESFCPKCRQAQYDRNAHLKTKFGITVETYNKMFEAQGGCCRICAKHQTEVKRTFAVDHDHKTGKVRALLCNPCNIALGLLREDTSAMKSMIAYVVQHKEDE